LSFTPVKNTVQKLNPAKTGVDFQQAIGPHPDAGRNVVINNSVELNILIGTNMTFLTPQDKKRLSYEHDRRNAYGENAKASRKAIPRRKQQGRQAGRRSTKQIIPAAYVADDLLADNSVENRIASIDGKRQRWRKSPDIPLRDFVQRQKKRRVVRFDRKKNVVPLPGLPGCFMSTPNIVDHEGILKRKNKK
jgi:hypothetical protein